MLNLRSIHFVHARSAGSPAKQRGVVLLITLIVLVAMTLAAISLMRSTDTTNIIAGNLAFRQSTTYSGDFGLEAAVSWIEKNGVGNTLHNDQPGYNTRFQDPPAGTSWDTWWNQQTGNPIAVPVALLPDVAGNTVSYYIERMCGAAGPPSPTTCQSTTATVPNSGGNSAGSGSPPLSSAPQTYYRITVQTQGPRKSFSYVQTIVSL